MDSVLFLKGIFAIAIGSLAMVFLRAFVQAYSGTETSSPTAPQEGGDDEAAVFGVGVHGALPFPPDEQLFFDELGPWRASQQTDEWTQKFAEIEEQSWLLANHSTFSR